MAIYSGGTSVANATNLQAPRLTGALPAIDGSSVTGVSPPTTHLAVGTYAAFFYQSTDSVAAGATAAGSDLKYLTTPAYNTWQTSEANGNGTAASGTWRNMSAHVVAKAGNDPRPTGLWCRTA